MCCSQSRCVPKRFNSASNPSMARNAVRKVLTGNSTARYPMAANSAQLTSGVFPNSVILATNGRVIATSDVYPTRRNCLQGIESVRKNAPGATVVEESAAARRPARTAKAPAGGGATRRAAAQATVKTAAATTGTSRSRQAKAPVAAPATKRTGRSRKAASTSPAASTG